MELSVSWPGVSEPGLVHISKLQSHLKHKLQFNMKKKKRILGSFTQTSQIPGPSMYTSATVCSLCIWSCSRDSLKQSMVHKPVTCLTKQQLSHCHWMCFMSNK